MATAKSIVLVHGAWADGSSWQKIIPKLAAEGFALTAVQLPLSSFEDDVATVRRALAIAEGPVLLVGHSYGGAVITEAGADPKVAGLVYVAAFGPEAGESAGSLLGTVAPSPLGGELRPDANGFLKMTHKGMFEDFAQDLPESERLIQFAVHAPTAGRSLGGPITAPAWKTKPSWYIIAMKDRAIPPELEAKMAKRMNAETISLDAGHLVMLSQPDAVAAFVSHAAR